LLKETGSLRALADSLGISKSRVSMLLPARLRECFYTTPELAKELNLHRDTVKDWVLKGKLPAVKYGNKFLIPKWLVDRGSS